MDVASQLCCPTCGYSRPQPKYVDGGRFSCPNCRTTLVSIQGADNHDLFELIERDLFTLSAKIAKALKSPKAEKIVREMSQGHSCEGLIESVEWSDPEKVEGTTLLALCGCCVSRIVESIMADGVVMDDELIIANQLCRPIADLFASRFDAYALFADLTMEKTREFLTAFESDSSWFGGSPDSEPDIVAGILCGAATATTGDQGIVDGFELLFETVAMRILAVDGITSEEEALFLRFKDQAKAIRELIEIYTRESMAPGSRGAEQARPVAKIVATATFDTASKALAELNGLVGLTTVKKEIQRLMSFLTVQKARQKYGCQGSSQSLHFVFAGNPGTGKTTVARLLGQILFGCGLISSAKVVECDRGKLVGASLGETAIKSEAVIQSADGGVLYIEEPYLLASGRGSAGAAQSEAAFDRLLKRMDNDRDPLVVIIAGNLAQMDNFLTSNPRLKSRFSRSISFADYTVADMCRIFERICIENDYSLTPNSRAYLFLHFNLVRQCHEGPFENARVVRNTFDSALSFQNERLAARAVPASNEVARQLEGVDILNSSTHESEIRSTNLSMSKWDGECPECHRPMQMGIANLGKRVLCKCGSSFIFPWWNPVQSSIPGLSSRPVNAT